MEDNRVDKASCCEWPLWCFVSCVTAAMHLGHIYIYISYRRESEGLARTGYVVSGCMEDRPWMLEEDSSAAAVVAAVVCPCVLSSPPPALAHHTSYPRIQL